MKDKFKNTVIKADIVEKVYQKVGFTRQEASEAVEVLLEEMKAVLGSGENIRIVGFASFNLRQKKERIARNPKTGDAVWIKPRRVLTFKPSKQLLESTNAGIMNESADN
ncbi:MAG: integration host factor subunit alpha [Nitrospinae bacterium RIFCSPLOWO2_12_FULL_47_7]|nr:MAG: integration host factor subunit alpha [Nitrospinae bacterium RIFCSPLOWO2_12_FULL_47_7]